MADDIKDSENGAGADETTSAPPIKPFSKRGSHMPPPKAPSAPASRPSIPGSSASSMTAPVPPRRYETRYGVDTDGRKLIVGRSIELAGKITACDKLVVEGTVEVDLDGARMIEIAPGGTFRGKADVEEADISGAFDGELIARKRLIVRQTGQVGGNIKYAGIVIEPGGQVHGNIAVMSEDDDEPPKLPSPSK